jgi:hypothetical protein
MLPAVIRSAMGDPSVPTAEYLTGDSDLFLPWSKDEMARGRPDPESIKAHAEALNHAGIVW